MAINAIQKNAVEIDAMSGGIKLEIQWSRLKPSLSLVDVKSLSREEFAGLKNQIKLSMVAKGGREEAANFILNLYNLGPGKYRNVNELPYNFQWIDWYLPMIEEADRIQRLGREVRKAEGAGLEFMGYQRTNGPVSNMSTRNNDQSGFNNSSTREQSYPRNNGDGYGRGYDQESGREEFNSPTRGYEPARETRK